jgi:hypothetical protein
MIDLILESYLKDLVMKSVVYKISKNVSLSNRLIKIVSIIIFIVSVALLNGFLLFRFFYKAGDVIVKTTVMH